MNDSQNKIEYFLDVNSIIKKPHESELHISIKGTENKPVTYSPNIGNIIPMLGLIATLVIFMLQNKKQNKTRKKSLKENWFLTIIVQPNLQLINEYYNSIDSELVQLINKLKKTNRTSIDITKGKSMNIIKKIKYKHIFDFIILVQSHDNALAQNINDQIQEIEDYCIEQLDDFNNTNESDIKRKISENKSRVIALLYNGLSINS